MNRTRPIVWYIAAGYKLPAGIEAYLCHYATELRNHGFDTRIIVFYPLPRDKHRFLKLLEERSIPIMSLYDETAAQVDLLCVFFSIPWLLYTLTFKRKFPDLAAFRSWMQNRCAVRRLADKIRDEAPDILHVKGRLPTNAWAVFPSERTIYHHALMGTIDPSWTAAEVADFRVFANRIARIFAPGKSVARTFAHEYRIDRQIDSLFTMAPDEAADQCTVSSKQFHENNKENLRFGILCRFTEQKGISYILEALKSFKAKHGDVDFTFAGQGELEPVIRRFVEVEGLDNVRILSVDEPVKVLRTIDVFVHPGLDDAMPVSIVEALMCGIPCISTTVGGTPDLVRDGVEGFLIGSSNSAQILECMERFVKMSAGEFMDFCVRARARYAEVCQPEKVGGIVAGHYRGIIAANDMLRTRKA